MRYVVVLDSRLPKITVEAMLAAAVAQANDSRWRGGHWEPGYGGVVVHTEAEYAALPAAARGDDDGAGTPAGGTPEVSPRGDYEEFS